ncbi:hypothetical protein [Streptomyces venezuelae]|uniref:hypothetical protein n=1 Tax=Streptomyces venezuelae TaxID=54571 RepID=UPI00365FF153
MTWPHVDYDTDLWMQIPNSWEGTPWKGPKEWGRELSAVWWDDSGLEPTRKDLKLLAATLRSCAERFPLSHPGFDVYLHLPDPRLMPLPVYVASIEAEGDNDGDRDRDRDRDRDESLRALVTTDDPALVEKPIVEDFTTESLGTGLRSLRYTQVDAAEAESGAGANGDTLVAGVRYAWRHEATRCDVLVIVSAPDPRRVLGAMDDLDDFVRRIGMPGPGPGPEPGSGEAQGAA